MSDIFGKAMDMVLGDMGRAATAAKAKKYKRRDPSVEEEEHDGPHAQAHAAALVHEGSNASPTHDELQQLLERNRAKEDEVKDLEVQR